MVSNVETNFMSCPIKNVKQLCKEPYGPMASVTRLGNFWKFLATIFLSKVAQENAIVGNQVTNRTRFSGTKLPIEQVFGNQATNRTWVSGTKLPIERDSREPNYQ